MTHTCHAVGCEVTVPPEKLMCLRHWRMVPGLIKAAVLTTYRVGQCDDKQPSPAYLVAARRAIKAVREREVSR